MIISFYFGKMPNYFQLWLNSCACNPSIDWLLLTDDRTRYSYPNNIKLKYISFDEMKHILKEKLELNVDFKNPYKTTDFRPAFGFVFSEYLTGYDFWGFCDIDIIFGDIREFITDDILNNYTKILKHGHFTLVKNNNEGNHLFMLEVPNYKNYKTIYQSNHMYAFDEWGGFTPISEKTGVKQFYEMIYADVNVCHHFFHLLFIDSGYTPQVFLWNKGKLSRFYFHEGVIREQFFMYIHLQKRKMKISDANIYETEKYYIGPHDFFIDSNHVFNYDRLLEINKCKLFYSAWVKILLKWKVEALVYFLVNKLKFRLKLDEK